MTRKITILGGGIGGLTTAIGLRNTGIECEVFEAAEAFKPVGAGLSIALNAMKALEYLGVEKEVLEKGFRYREGKVLSSKGKTLQTLPMDLLRKKYQSEAITIHRHALHEVLSKKLGDTKVHFNKKCIRFERAGNSLLLTFADGSQHTTNYLIAVDGIHSIVRKTLLPDTKERFSGQTCWRGICEKEIPSLNYAVLSESWGLGTRFGIVPLPDKKVYWFAVKDARKEEAHWASYTNEQLAELFAGYHSPVAEIIRNTPEHSVFWNNLNDLKPIAQFAFGNVLLLGDAAHATTPNLGQGACMAIEDAAVLSSTVKTELSIEKAFEKFETERIARTTKIVNTSYQMGKMAQTSNPLLAGIRNFMLPLVPESANKKFFDFMFGIQFR